MLPCESPCRGAALLGGPPVAPLDTGEERAHLDAGLRWTRTPFAIGLGWGGGSGYDGGVHFHLRKILNMEPMVVHQFLDDQHRAVGRAGRAERRGEVVLHLDRRVPTAIWRAVVVNGTLGQIRQP